MRILVHLCCGPCGITVLQSLLGAGHELAALFFNPNIQPLSEYMRRWEGAFQVAQRLGVAFIPGESLSVEEQVWDDLWLDGRQAQEFAPGGVFAVPPAVNPALWLRAVAGREDERCVFCWRIRLRKTAQLAAQRGFDGFTSSLLYSRHQDHGAICELGERMAEETELAFVYEDFRIFWQEGIRLSKEWGIYRQPYCGCCFSEYDRYAALYSRSLLP